MKTTTTISARKTFVSPSVNKLEIENSKKVATSGSIEATCDSLIDRLFLLCNNSISN